MQSGPYDDVAFRVVQKGEYQELIDALMVHGCKLSSLVSAVNAHRYVVDDEEPNPMAYTPSILNRAGFGGLM